MALSALTQVYKSFIQFSMFLKRAAAPGSQAQGRRVLLLQLPWCQVSTPLAHYSLSPGQPDCVRSTPAPRSLHRKSCLVQNRQHGPPACCSTCVCHCSSSGRWPMLT